MEINKIGQSMNINLPCNTIEAIMCSKTCSKKLQDPAGQKINITEEGIDLFQNIMGVKNMSSAFVSFYTSVGFPPENNNSPELLTLNGIISDSEPDGYFAEYLENYPEIASLFGKRYFVLTGGEEEGFFFYDSTMDAVYDTDDFVLTKPNEYIPAPKWNTFYDFLDDYYGSGVYLS